MSQLPSRGQVWRRQAAPGATRMPRPESGRQVAQHLVLVKQVHDGVVHYSDYTANIKSPVKAAWQMDLDRFTVLYQLDAKATRNRTARLARLTKTSALHKNPKPITDPAVAPYVPLGAAVLRKYNIKILGTDPVDAGVEGDGVDLFYQLDKLSGKQGILQLDFKAGQQQPQEVKFVLQCAKAEPFAAPGSRLTVADLLTAVSTLQQCRTQTKSSPLDKEKAAREVAKFQVVDLLIALVGNAPGLDISNAKELAKGMAATPDLDDRFKPLIPFLQSTPDGRWNSIVAMVQARQSTGVPLLPGIEKAIWQVIQHEWKGGVALTGQYGILANESTGKTAGNILVQLTGAPYPTYFSITTHGTPVVAKMAISLCDADFVASQLAIMQRLITADITLFAARKTILAPAKSPDAKPDLKALMPDFKKMPVKNLMALMESGVVMVRDTGKNDMVYQNRAADPKPVFTLKAAPRGTEDYILQENRAKLALAIAAACKETNTSYYFRQVQGEPEIIILGLDNPYTPLHSFVP